MPLDVFWHNCHTLAWIVHRFNFSHQMLEGKFANQKFSGLLIMANFTGWHSTRPVMMRFHHFSSTGCTLVSGFCRGQWAFWEPWYRDLLTYRPQLLWLELRELEAVLVLKSNLWQSGRAVNTPYLFLIFQNTKQSLSFLDEEEQWGRLYCGWQLLPVWEDCPSPARYPQASFCGAFPQLWALVPFPQLVLGELTLPLALRVRSVT